MEGFIESLLDVTSSHELLAGRQNLLERYGNLSLFQLIKQQRKIPKQSIKHYLTFSMHGNKHDRCV